MTCKPASHTLVAANELSHSRRTRDLGSMLPGRAGPSFLDEPRLARSLPKNFRSSHGREFSPGLSRRRTSRTTCVDRSWSTPQGLATLGENGGRSDVRPLLIEARTRLMRTSTLLSESMPASAQTAKGAGLDLIQEIDLIESVVYKQQGAEGRALSVESIDLCARRAHRSPEARRRALINPAPFCTWQVPSCSF